MQESKDLNLTVISIWNHQRQVLKCWYFIKRNILRLKLKELKGHQRGFIEDRQIPIKINFGVKELWDKCYVCLFEDR